MSPNVQVGYGSNRGWQNLSTGTIQICEGYDIIQLLTWLGYEGSTFTLKSILRRKKNYGNSNISPCKNIIFKKNPLTKSKILQDIITL